MTLGCAVAVVFLSISAYFCIRRRPNNRNSGNTSAANTNSSYRNTSGTPATVVGYNATNCNVVIRETNALPKKKENPDIVPRMVPNTKAGKILLRFCPILQISMHFWGSDAVQNFQKKNAKTFAIFRI